jgi:hypothetical protein
MFKREYKLVVEDVGREKNRGYGEDIIWEKL